MDNRNQLTNIVYGHYADYGSCYYDDNGSLVALPLDASIMPGTTYCYDDENRLVRWIYVDLAGGILGCDDPPADEAGRKREFDYDGLGRMRIMREYLPGSDSHGNPIWVLSNERHYIYDGWRVIQERDSNNVPTVSYTRGTDLSGSLEGAGGIGGLLARSHGYSGGNWITNSYYFADGNGNVTSLLNSSQAAVAAYRYDAFGNLTGASGTLVWDNAYRFSSKESFASWFDDWYLHGELYYFGYRFYDPNLQRWLNRDPLGDAALLNATLTEDRSFMLPSEYMADPNSYSFAQNDSVNSLDAIGLISFHWPAKTRCINKWSPPINGPMMCTAVSWKRSKTPNAGKLKMCVKYYEAALARAAATGNYGNWKWACSNLAVCYAKHY